MFIFYDIFFILFALMYIPYLTIKGKWHKGFWLRMGFYPVALIEALSVKENIWIHAVSVGEVMAVLDLIKLIRLEYPEKRIVLSAVTKTGYALAQEKLSPEDIVVYAPLDFSPIVRKVLSAIRPCIYISAETELWPNLYWALQKKRIPLVQVNGRISDRAFKGYKRVRGFIKNRLRDVDAFCMQSNVDADRIVALGALIARVKVVGNIKFDLSFDAQSFYKEKLGFKSCDQIFVAGSTHPGEEELLLNVFNQIKTQFKDLKLIIAPRHVERVEEVVALIKKFQLRPKRYSQFSDEALDQESVIVVDTIGKLRSLYSMATLVFIGKTFCGVGGQNVIEPAYFGKPVIVGPHMENFSDIINLFLKDRALIQLDDPKELQSAITELLRSPAQLQNLGKKAKEVVIQNKGATQKTLETIKYLLMASC